MYNFPIYFDSHLFEILLTYYMLSHIYILIYPKDFMYISSSTKTNFGPRIFGPKDFKCLSSEVHLKAARSQ